MKTLILFASKYGSAEVAAKKLKEKITGEVVIKNIRKDNLPDLSEFDAIILGGSIYAGRIQKEILEFIRKNRSLLESKKRACFVMAGERDEQKQLEQINRALKDCAEVFEIKETMGDAVYYDKLNFIEKILMKMIRKSTESYENISDEKIEKLASMLSK